MCSRPLQLVSAWSKVGPQVLCVDADKARRPLFRHCTVSSASSEFLLVDLRLRPGSSLFTLLDDHGLTGSPEASNPGTLKPHILYAMA